MADFSAPLSNVSRTQITRPLSIFGQGPAFPLRVGADGRLAWSSAEENVRQAIRILLLTEPGERIMREEYGCGLRSFLFEPNTPTVRQLIRERIQQTIQRWEPRVAVDDVQVEPDPLEARLAHITILFHMIATQAVQAGSIDSLNLTLQLEG